MAKNDNLKDFLTDVADAIREKKGTTDLINPQSFSDEIRAFEIGGGGGGGAASANAVNFRDYDGTILHSYSKDEFLALSELPQLPTQKGLICQEWNYTLEDAKSYVADYGVLDIGATYITDDGKTRLYITIAAEGRMNVPLMLQQSVSEGVIVDWGDGNTETFSGTSATTLRHTYSKVGDYVISLEVINGNLTLKGSASCGIIMDAIKAYGNMLQKVEIGNNITNIGENAFYNCYSLTSVVIPDNVKVIGTRAFYNCYSLTYVVIPNGIKDFGQNVFEYCYSLTSIVIPNSVTSIENYAFHECYSFASIIIPNSVTSIGSYAFQRCYSLTSVVIPNSVISIRNYAFYFCHSLISIVIPNGVSSITSYSLGACVSLVSIVIPNSVKTIGAYALMGSSVPFYDFSTHTSVPTLSNVSAFSNISSDSKIIVPDALYDEWITATNWSSYANIIIKQSEYEANK